jgi:hypothetical protein
LDKGNKMTLADKIKLACKSSGELIYIPSYSGRGMYGDRCVAVSGAKSAIEELLRELIRQEILYNDNREEAEDTVQSLLARSTDSMGRGTVHYWPCILSEGQS